jgi:selenocysteine lyase/cysteine desulfurase
MRDDFPTVTYPFTFLLPQVEKRWVESGEFAQGPDAVFRLVDGRTRMVAVSWVHFLTGVRFDVAELCRFCRERGVVSVIDAIQGLGVVDFDWSPVGADFVVSHGAKWLLAPQGSGFMYVNPASLPALRPYNFGWLSAAWQEFNDILGDRPMRPDARRYEEGTKNYLGIWGLAGSLRLFDETGMAVVEQRVRMLAGRLRERLGRAGFEIVTPAEPDRSAGIVTCLKPGADMAGLHRRLTEAGICVSLRENMLRIAPHFYNTLEETDRLVGALPV